MWSINSLKFSPDEIWSRLPVSVSLSTLLDNECSLLLLSSFSIVLIVPKTIDTEMTTNAECNNKLSNFHLYYVCTHHKQDLHLEYLLYIISAFYLMNCWSLILFHWIRSEEWEMSVKKCTESDFLLNSLDIHIFKMRWLVDQRIKCKHSFLLEIMAIGLQTVHSIHFYSIFRSLQTLP